MSRIIYSARGIKKGGVYINQNYFQTTDEEPVLVDKD